MVVAEKAREVDRSGAVTSRRGSRARAAATIACRTRFADGTGKARPTPSPSKWASFFFSEPRSGLLKANE